MDALHAFQRDLRRHGIRAHRHRQRVKNQVFGLNAILLRLRQNAFGNGHAPVRRGGNAAFIQRERHYKAAVLLYQREHRIHALLLAVYAVHHRLAVIAAQGGFHGDSVCGVDLQGQIDDGLQLTYRSGDHLHLIDFRQTHIHIQHMHALFLLAETFTQNVVDVMRSQGFLEGLFARGVDALADQHSFPAKEHRMAVGGHAGICFFRKRNRLHFFGRNRADVLRRGAAAAARKAHALGKQLMHLMGKILRHHIVDRAAVAHLRQTRIGLEQHRHRGVF